MAINFPASPTNGDTYAYGGKTWTYDGTATKWVPSSIVSDITATAAELNILDGATVTTAELNTLDGVTATTAELNFVDGVTSNLQTQLDNITVTSGTLTKSFASGETASIALSSALSPAPIVSVTKEVPQTGVISKGAWDVASSGANYDRLDTAYSTTLEFFSEGWDVSTASFLQFFYIGSQESSPSGVVFKSDGTKMYVVGQNGDEVNEYDLSTAWDISTASFVHNFSVQTQDPSPTDIFFKPDGLKMYIVGDSGNDINEYNLSTAWDVSTASYNQNFSVAGQEINPQAIFFKPDGTKMYVSGFNGVDVNEYNLSTAWDISTAVYSQNFSVAAQESNPNGMFFKHDGTKMYISGPNNDNVNEYNLSTAWDISTASYSQNFRVAVEDGASSGVFFKPDGSKMYIIGLLNTRVNEYDLDLTQTLTLGTGSFASSDVGKTIEGNDGVAVLTATDGSYSEVTAFNDSSTIASGDWGMFGVTFDATSGIKGSFSAVNAWDISTAVYSQNFSVSAQETAPTGVFFKPDGTKMYIIGSTGDDVNEYSLTTAWDVSTSSYIQNFSVSAQDSIPTNIFFKPDGTKMYVTGDLNNRVNEYNLSTAWDISTASYAQSYTSTSTEASPAGIFFKPDGTKMYLSGTQADEVNEYDLSTAWDISTVVFNQVFSVAGQEANPAGIFFKFDGTKMYIVGYQGDDVNEYSLTTAWDISTASYSQLFPVYDQDQTPRDLFFKPDGTKMYILGSTGDDVNEYDIGSVVSATGYIPSITNAGGQIDTEYWTDINSMTTDDIAGAGAAYYAVSTDDRTTWSVINEADGVRPIVRDNAGTWEYNSNASYASQTWANSTTNSELYALQQALTDVSINRMDKAQLEAVTDPNHYTLGDSLDLMIGLYLGSASSDVPSSDGVSINYDATALNQGAVLGTDYNYDFPDSTTVRVTSNAAQNLKVRVV